MRSAFTLVEILIVVIILGILAAITVPKLSDAASDSESAMLKSNASLLQKQIELYIIQHGGKGPHLNEQGKSNSGQFVERMTSKTDPTGKINSSGSCGPYIDEWPKNPRISNAALADKVQIDGWPNGQNGWWYSTDYQTIIASDPESVQDYLAGLKGK